MSDPFIGEVRIFANNYVPQDWLPCDGRSLPVQAYTPLYAVIGNLYGGNNVNFNLPNLNGRVAVGSGLVSHNAGTISYAVGNIDGVETVTLDLNHTPAHTHQLQKKTTSAGGAGKTAVPSALSDLGGLSATTGASYSAVIANGPPNTSLSPTTLGAAGGSGAHENRQPYLGLYFAIATVGEFPTRP
jgi:microcystin-dependent protein